MGETKIQWTAVPTHSGYFASRYGKIKGPSGYILKPMPNKSGHLYVLTPLPRRPRKLFVHRAVLFAFVGLPLGRQETRHLNGNPKDNRLSNLKWGSRSENQKDAVTHGTRRTGVDAIGAKFIQSQIKIILESNESSRSLGVRFGVSHTTILKIINGDRYVL